MRKGRTKPDLVINAQHVYTVSPSTERVKRVSDILLVSKHILIRFIADNLPIICKVAVHIGFVMWFRWSAITEIYCESESFTIIMLFWLVDHTTSDLFTLRIFVVHICSMCSITCSGRHIRVMPMSYESLSSKCDLAEMPLLHVHCVHNVFAVIMLPPFLQSAAFPNIHQVSRKSVFWSNNWNG